MRNDSRSAYDLALLATKHAVSGDLDSIQFAILRHFTARESGEKNNCSDLAIAAEDLDAAIEILELAAYMLRHRRADCLESLKP